MTFFGALDKKKNNDFLLPKQQRDLEWVMWYIYITNECELGHTMLNDILNMSKIITKDIRTDRLLPRPQK